MVRINTSPVTYDTKKIFTNNDLAEPGAMLSFFNGKHKSKKERANIYTAIMASINSAIKEAYIHAHNVDTQCGVYLAVWIYLTYSMETDQHK